MIRYFSNTLIVFTLLIKQSVVIDVFDPPGTENNSATEAANEFKVNEDNSDEKYNNSFINSRLSEGGDDITVNAPKPDKPMKQTANEGNGKTPSVVENGSNVGETDVNNESRISSVVARKGVHNSSVVPKKGAPTDKSQEEADSNFHRIKINTDKTVQPVKDELVTSSQENSLSRLIKKKPVTSDKDSDDDDDDQSYIESSSTEQDYMLTGVLIFVCIWASIFGALFLYKRAGEFWGRRHYRRMDFLVEGMYND